MTLASSPSGGSTTGRRQRYCTSFTVNLRAAPARHREDPWDAVGRNLTTFDTPIVSTVA
jgi:hypothetical protein